MQKPEFAPEPSEVAVKWVMPDRAIGAAAHEQGLDATLSRFSDPATSRTDGNALSGDLVVWVFILAELTSFAVFFLVYAFARVRYLAEFNQYQQTLDLRSGAINTVLLITGSWLVVRAVHAIRNDQVSQSIGYYWAALACGGGFLAVKVMEYSEKFAAGYDLSTNTFFMFYFSLTYFHFMHVILGMVFLSVVLFKTYQGHYGSHRSQLPESAAAYWHMVDLLWIVLFPLLYVMH